MVVSKLNPEINYIELSKVNEEDLKKQLNLYEINVFSQDIIISIGNIQHFFSNKNISYFPIYLITKKKKALQIGLFEIKATNSLEYFDEKGNLLIEKMDEPLIYSFVTPEYIEENKFVLEQQKKEEPKEEEEEKDVIKFKKEHFIPENRKDIFILTKGIEIPSLLKEETKKSATDIIEKYHTKNSDNWIVKYMKNNYYDIVENEGGCDSFFSCIRDAFSQIAQQTSIQKLRKKFVDCVTEDVFLFYKDNYIYLYNILNDIIKHTKNLNIEYDKIRESYNNILDRDEKKQLTEKGKSIKAQHDKLLYEKKYVSQFLKEFKFMKTIDNIDKFKKHLSSCEFWGNKWSVQWAITLMEYCLNIKFILFSKEYYRENDSSNIIQLGLGNHNFQLSDALEKKRKFEPDYYILLAFDQPKQHSALDYKLISYKKKHIFTFSELPYYIKKTIVNKYNEKNAGLFAVIPEFHKFKKMVGNKSKISNVDTASETNIEELSESNLTGIYDDSTTFISYINSNNNPFPGFGVGEKIQMNMFLNFVDLALIDKWRRKLSNEWIQPFTLDNHSWNSVEHYYQGSKFKRNNPDFYLTFSLDSGSDLSKSVEMARLAGGKVGVGNGQLRPENIEIDPDFYKSRYEKEMYEAQYAKFTQNKELKALLTATKNAKLMHYVNGKPLEEYKHLMEIREKLMNE
jgi:predicted NAD-dependent protein-ADP-ribosyltransferase YbiA (DUF1768 family)